MKKTPSIAFVSIAFISSFSAMGAGNLQDGLDADLIYNRDTGNVILDPTDTDAGRLISFTLSRIFDAGDLRPDNFMPPFADTGFNTDASVNQIGQLDGTLVGLDSPHDVGDIFPAGFESAEQLSQYLSLAIYASALGQGGELDLIAYSSGDVTLDGELDEQDIDLLSVSVRSGSENPLLDVNRDGAIDNVDRRHWVHELKGTYFGDANLDGEFSTTDLISVFQVGIYEDDVPLNATWATGDWNGDGDFSTSDMVVAFQDGGFELGPRRVIQTVPEPGTLSLLSIGILLAPILRNSRRELAKEQSHRFTLPTA